jgi:hypothetical protein
MRAPFQLGIGMEGLAPQVAPFVEQISTQFSEITYLEIGTAHGVTLTNVCAYIRDHGAKWRGVGLDLPDGYCLEKNAITRNAHVRKLPLSIQSGPSGKVSPPFGEITVYLKNAHTFFPENWTDPVQFALIDGCHCAKCFATDFLLLEPFLVSGAIVMAHDIDEISQGQQEPRGHGFRGVRNASKDLGIFNSTRPGWTMLAELQSDPNAGNMGIFQKT